MPAIKQREGSVIEMTPQRRINMENRKDPFIRGDGWDKEALKEVGVLDFLDDVGKFSYEIETCRRGSVAGIGNTGQDVMNLLMAWKEDLDAIIDKMEAELRKV